MFKIVPCEKPVPCEEHVLWKTNLVKICTFWRTLLCVVKSTLWRMRIVKKTFSNREKIGVKNISKKVRVPEKQREKSVLCVHKVLSVKKKESSVWKTSKITFWRTLLMKNSLWKAAHLRNEFLVTHVCCEKVWSEWALWKTCTECKTCDVNDVGHTENVFHVENVSYVKNMPHVENVCHVKNVSQEKNLCHVKSVSHVKKRMCLTWKTCLTWRTYTLWKTSLTWRTCTMWKTSLLWIKCPMW